MQSFMLDSNLFDVLSEKRLEAVTEAVELGRLDLVMTHVQLDEIARTPDLAKRKRLESVPVREIPTMGTVFEYSGIERARFGPAEPIEAIRRNNLPHTEAHAGFCVEVACRAAVTAFSRSPLWVS
ncbi:MAG TPA: hypothetical protein VN636_00420 [Acidimicrobiia bacterium]|nr:hypothetical protein [Acidimicrobiia bacterium]